MGSGSSSQVKNIDNKTAVNNDSAPPVKKEMVTASNKKTLARTVPNPNMPDTAYVGEETVAPAVVMPLPAPATVPESPGAAASTDRVDRVALPPSDLELKVTQLQKELNESESQKLDLQDRIQALEERLQEAVSAAAAGGEAAAQAGEDPPGDEGRAPDDGGAAPPSATHLQQTLGAKDSYILQMERQSAAAEEEWKKTRARLKRKIKTLTAQLSEARQESSIAQLELKERNADLQEQLLHSGQGDTSVTAKKKVAEDDSGNDPRMKVILDLSAEVSEQSGRIAVLERTVREKDKEIEQLKREASRHTPRQSMQPVVVHSDSGAQQPVRPQTLNQAPVRSSLLPQLGPNPRHVVLTGPSGPRGVAPVEETTVTDYYSSRQGGVRPTSKPGPRPRPSPAQPLEPRLSLHRQSTALSDSDSDWEVETPSSKIHSAPARVRVKSAARAAEDRPSTQRDVVDDKWSIATDDNDLNTTTTTATTTTESRLSGAKQKRRSALKTRLERERNERAKGLMGPTLAFAAPACDQLSDVSSTPTPRPADLGSQFTTSDVMAFAV
ncbi:uncharacterized protein LOC143282357 [Babylonia areolata]|uniref:uncharacterized protein LOC143282357 n=1 Tax=Babylonia areolata TaxID=304850 RepID=UPI003FCFD18B